MAHRPMPERFWDKVDRDSDPDGCWTWTAYATPRAKGCLPYGKFGLDGRVQFAHRVAYTLTRGPVPDGMQLDHLCRNTLCVRPEHLEPVTARVNILRGQSFAPANAAKTHCPKGHEYTPANTMRGNSPTERKCRTCYNAYQREWKRRRKAAAS